MRRQNLEHYQHSEGHSLFILIYVIVWTWTCYMLRQYSKVCSISQECYSINECYSKEKKKKSRVRVQKHLKDSKLN